MNTAWAEPLDPYDASDLEASETDMQFGLGWYAQPILMDGKYPTVMREKVCSPYSVIIENYNNFLKCM